MQAKTAPVWKGAVDFSRDNWPSADLYNSMADASQPFVLTPGIVSILASLTPEQDQSQFF